VIQVTPTPKKASAPDPSGAIYIFHSNTKGPYRAFQIVDKPLASKGLFRIVKITVKIGDNVSD
jgi:hypothetical protein